MDVVVEITGWEHDCCGPAIDRGQGVELGCVRKTGADGVTRLVETHHGDDVDVVVTGRVTDVGAVHADGSLEPIRRLPSGEALRGLDDVDDGHLERPWTGRRVERSGDGFRVTVSVE